MIQISLKDTVLRTQTLVLTISDPPSEWCVCGGGAKHTKFRGVTRLRYSLRVNLFVAIVAMV